MKIFGRFLISAIAISLFAVTNSDAQIYVKAPLTAPANIVRSKANSKYEVWVPEDWDILENKRYIYHPGYWAFPPTPKSVYIPGAWKKDAKGYYRIPGYWKNPHL